VARYLAKLQLVQVFRRDFFGGSYVSERVEKKPATGSDEIGVRFARMVDVLSAVATKAAVNGPFFVDVADTLLARCALPALGLSERDFFSDVFGDQLVPAEPRGGETSRTVDAGFCDPESRCEFLIHL